MAQGWRGVVPAETEGRHLFECSKPHCFRRLTFKTLEAARQEEVSHPCPWWGGETKVSWSVTKTLVQQLWDKLDEEYVQIIEKSTPNPEFQRGRARAFAESIAIFMPPFFSTADDVIREAGRRYKAKQEGEEYETPGLGIRRYEGAIRDDKPRRRTPVQTAEIHVDEQVKKAIKFALESGMFTHDQLSKTYKLSIDTIKLIETS